MMKSLGLAIAVGALMAVPAAADWTASDEAELQAMVTAFREGADIDGARLAELAADAAAETGTIPTGLFDGVLTPIATPIALTAMPRVRIECVTNVVSEIPLPAFPPTYEEVSVLTRNAVNDGGILYETTDPVSVMRLGAEWNADGFAWREIFMDDEFGVLRLRPMDDGTLLDEETGDIYPADGEEALFLSGLVDALSSVNPWWFLTETQVQVGDAWLDPEREGDLIAALRTLVVTSIGVPDATVSENVAFTAVTGLTELNGAETLVFEIMLDVELDAPGVGVVDLRIAGVEFYDVSHFVRVGMDNELRVSAPGFGLEMTQDQGCSVAAE